MNLFLIRLLLPSNAFAGDSLFNTYKMYAFFIKHLISARKDCKQCLCIHIHVYMCLYILIYVCICMFFCFFLLFLFHLFDRHISARTLLYVSLVYFLFKYCVNKLYRKKNSSGAAICKYSWKKLLWKVSQNVQEKSCPGVSF